MPRCFMAKKLKYPYEQWKEQQESNVKPETAVDEGKLCLMSHVLNSTYSLLKKQPTPTVSQLVGSG